MSTRATYQFKNSKDKFSPNTTIYVHMDNYPKGAATWFWYMHHCENQRGGFADKFLRANENAELTKSHSTHGDTEYWYTMDGETLTAEKVVYKGDYKDEVRCGEIFFKGHYTEFINQYGKDGFMDNFSVIKKVKVSEYGYEQWLTLDQLKEKHSLAVTQYLNYKKNFPQPSANLDYHKNEVDILAESLKNF